MTSHNLQLKIVARHCCNRFIRRCTECAVVEVQRDICRKMYNTVSECSPTECSPTCNNGCTRILLAGKCMAAVGFARLPLFHRPQRERPPARDMTPLLKGLQRPLHQVSCARLHCRRPPGACSDQFTLPCFSSL